jgi:hypothetical protein
MAADWLPFFRTSFKNVGILELTLAFFRTDLGFFMRHDTDFLVHICIRVSINATARRDCTLLFYEHSSFYL